MDELRVIADSPADGAWNMAVEEGRLASAPENGPANLRFYAWSEPTLSLGYFQAACDRNKHGASLDCTLVRRASGGGAIVHDRELAYSLALPGAPAAARLYEIVHSTLIMVLAELGVEARLFRDVNGCTNSIEPGDEPFL